MTAPGTLQGAIHDNGNVTLDSTGDLTKLVMGVPGSSGSVTLSGTGSILLSDNSNNLITGPGHSSPVTLINAGVTISGAGTIGGNCLTLNNRTGSLIAATGVNPLIIDTGSNAITNSGTLQANASSELFIASAVSNTGTINANSGTVFLEGADSGTGRAVINGTGQIEFAAASSNGVKFAAASTGELILDDSKQYTGTVSGFGANTTQSIDLTDIDFATATKSYANGTLTIKDGAGDTAHIKFSGTYTLASFNLQDDGQGGVLITDPPKQHLANIALLGNYMAATFVTPFDGHGGTLFTEAAQMANHLVSLATPHTG